MAIKKIQMNVKNQNSTYDTKFPRSNSDLTKRENNYGNINTLGSDATTMIQTLVNNYAPNNGSSWSTLTSASISGNPNAFAALNNCIVIGGIPSITGITYSLDFGATWKTIDMGETYAIIDVSLSMLPSGTYQATITSTGRTTRMTLDKNGYGRTQIANPSGFTNIRGVYQTRDGTCMVDSRGYVAKMYNLQTTWQAYTNTTSMPNSVLGRFKWCPGLDRSVGFGSNGYIFISQDHRSYAFWKNGKVGTSTTDFADVACGVGCAFFLDYANGYVYRASTDDLTFIGGPQGLALPTRNKEGERWIAITVGNGSVFVMSNFGSVTRSSDLGETWETIWGDEPYMLPPETRIYAHLDRIYRLLPDNGMKVQYTLLSPLK